MWICFEKTILGLQSMNINDDTCYLGILYTSKHKDTALDFVDYIINP